MSPSFKCDPDGRHSPFLKRFSELPFRYEGWSLKTRCMCIGFISGLENGYARGPLRAHLYDLGPALGFRLVGVERPEQVGRP